MACARAKYYEWNTGCAGPHGRDRNNKASAGAPRADTNNGMENSAAGIQGANAHSQTHAMSYASTVKAQQKKPHATCNAWHTQ